jgi:hypothetical protein
VDEQSVRGDAVRLRYSNDGGDTPDPVLSTAPEWTHAANIEQPFRVPPVRI